MATAADINAGLAENEFLFTSESVNEGHPDKMCDIVSDSVLDACLEQDPNSFVACETATKTNMVLLFGEITTKAKVDFEQVAREACRRIGYDDAQKGLDCNRCNVLVAIESQSPDIAQGVHEGKEAEDLGAGDQGIMFGYACNETECKMPLSHYLATQLGARLTAVRKENILPWVRPDGKTQVTCVYRKDSNGLISPVRVHTVLISTQHNEEVKNDQISEDLKEHVIKPVLGKWWNDKITFHLNPSGRFVIGGPHGDAGLTGRKIIVDTYGGWGAHGGGAFSGKDASKVDRSAAYAARWIAKSLVCAGLCDRVLVQLSYAIAVAHPLSVFVDSYGTSKKGDHELTKIVINNFDLRPGCIRKDLDLQKPIFSKTSCYGHFGRENAGFEWEKPKQLKF